MKRLPFGSVNAIFGTPAENQQNCLIEPYIGEMNVLIQYRIIVVLGSKNDRYGEERQIR